MNKEIIDLKGMKCPKPLIETRKRLKQSSTSFAIEIDDSTALSNITRFLSDNNIQHISSENAGVFTISIGESSDELPLFNQPEKVEIKTQLSNYAICINRLTMGSGDSSELGEVLLRTFINTISELDSVPSNIIFYNEGVKLATDDEQFISSLKKLNKLGIKILICGACLDYYKITDKVEVGTISNMFEILDVLSKASKVIYP